MGALACRVSSPLEPSGCHSPCCGTGLWHTCAAWSPHADVPCLLPFLAAKTSCGHCPLAQGLLGPCQRLVESHGARPRRGRQMAEMGCKRPVCCWGPVVVPWWSRGGHVVVLPLGWWMPSPSPNSGVNLGPTGAENTEDWSRAGLHPLAFACRGGSRGPSCSALLSGGFLSTSRKKSCSFPEGAGPACGGRTPCAPGEEVRGWFPASVHGGTGFNGAEHPSGSACHLKPWPVVW